MKIRLSELKRLIKQTIKEATVLDLSNDRQFQTKVPSYHTKSSSIPEGDPCECLECGLEFSCDASEDEMACCPSCGACGDSILNQSSSLTDDVIDDEMLPTEEEDLEDDNDFNIPASLMSNEDDWDSEDPDQFPKSTSGRKQYHR